jgi:uncharacterized membrane protein
MKKNIFLVLIILCFSFFANAEAFIITNYKVDIKINSNGSFDVTEKIDLNFSESRHGIIREIPFRYVLDDMAGFERASRDMNLGSYTITIRDISVEGIDYEVYNEGDYTCIKIGSADKYLEGDQQMIIHYTVWGALNKFSDHTEFYWNIVGHEWETDINKIEFSITLPSGSRPGNNDVIVFTGSSGDKGSDARYTVSGNTINGMSTRSFSSKQGLTMGIRFPLSTFQSTEIPIEMLAHNYYVESLESKITINKDASLDIEEIYQVNIIKPIASFDRELSIPGMGDINAENYQNFIIQNITGEISNSKQLYVTVSAKKEGLSKYISLAPRKGNLEGKYLVKLKFKVWGAIVFDENGTQVNWQLITTKPEEPVQKCKVTITADPSISLHPSAFRFNHLVGDPFEMNLTKDPKTNTVGGELDRIIPGGNGFYFKAYISANSFDISNIPSIIYAQNYYISRLKSEITVQENGVIHIKRVFNVHYIEPTQYDNAIDVYTYTGFYENNPLPYNIKMEMPNWSLFGRFSQMLITNYTTETNGWISSTDNEYGYRHLNIHPEEFNAKDSVFSFEFDIFGLLKHENGAYILNYPLNEWLEEPVMSNEFQIILPDRGYLMDLKAQVYFDDGTNRIPISIRKVKNRIYGEIMTDRPGNKLPMMHLVIPDDIISVSSGLKFRIIWANNRPLFLPLILLIALTVLWFFIGRDPKSALVVTYNPPKDITPAEAGLLWDNKLHRRDLVSLIYYWAGRGYLTITEIGTTSTPDYELIKLKDLPVDAKDFEKTIFSGIFTGVDTRKVSAMRNTFSGTMALAGTQLEKAGKTGSFYVPGTRGFGIFLKVIAWFLIIFGSFHIIFANHNNGQVMIGYLLSFAMLLFFGKIMPKRGHFGAKKYNELRGFREFIARAEKEKLKDLLAENPAYFDETVSYAIVMGLAEKWSEKFKDIITASPSWYHAQNPNVFNTTLFVSSMVHSMHKMENDFHYKYTPSSSGGSSSSSSFSYHSSGGSGFSSFGGGGSSGGGFGGGGGHSW